MRSAGGWVHGGRADLANEVTHHEKVNSVLLTRASMDGEVSKVQICVVVFVECYFVPFIERLIK